MRQDFFVRPDEDIVINEVNTMPGFTPISMFPRMWAATGVDYPHWSTGSSRPRCAEPPR